MSARTILANSFLRQLPHLPIGVLREAISGTVKNLPTQVRQWICTRLHGANHELPVGHVKFGSLRRVTPISRSWGFDRGGPIDRYYIERFLASHVEDIGGRVLEISENLYTRKFGGSRVTQSDVLDLTWGNPHATMVADLTDGKNIPAGIFDCIILTQTLHAIGDTLAVLDTLYRILKPGGTLLSHIAGHLTSEAVRLGWVLVWRVSFGPPTVCASVLRSACGSSNVWQCFSCYCLLRRPRGYRTQSAGIGLS